jgi:hypothetical protein
MCIVLEDAESRAMSRDVQGKEVGGGGAWLIFEKHETYPND